MRAVQKRPTVLRLINSTSYMIAFFYEKSSKKFNGFYFRCIGMAREFSLTCLFEEDLPTPLFKIVIVHQISSRRFYIKIATPT